MDDKQLKLYVDQSDEAARLIIELMEFNESIPPDCWASAMQAMFAMILSKSMPYEHYCRAMLRLTKEYKIMREE